ncbi:hypothetical protein SBA4_1050014 [Candidatus Sulfopaludibacter sp. SbA4]|nr:hypothetical protein SBA4_1050014 [Candidatus Sulfopaludibacter sp. SbA4]
MPPAGPPAGTSTVESASEPVQVPAESGGPAIPGSEFLTRDPGTIRFPAVRFPPVMVAAEAGFAPTESAQPGPPLPTELQPVDGTARKPDPPGAYDRVAPPANSGARPKNSDDASPTGHSVPAAGQFPVPPVAGWNAPATPSQPQLHPLPRESQGPHRPSPVEPGVEASEGVSPAAEDQPRLQPAPPSGDDTGTPARPDPVTEVAFQGLLIPLRAADERAPSGPVEPMSKPAGKANIAAASLVAAPADSASETPLDPVGRAEAAPHPKSDAPQPPPEEDRAVPARDRKPTSLPALPDESASAAAATSATLAIPTQPDRSPGQPQATEHPERIQTRIESEPPQPPAVPQDIKLEVLSGGQRVEIRVADRGGDVHVAVRTSDTDLAGALRDDLPALSSRLEQTGLRTDGWHTSAPAGGDWHRDVEHPAGSGSNGSNGRPAQDGREQSGDPQRRQSPKRETPVYEEQPHRKEKGKEFAWFMSPQP